MPAANTPTPRVLPLLDAAAYIGASRSKIYRLLAEGRLSARKIGRATVIERAQLDALIDQAPAFVSAAA